jgi:membrane protein DedA with SNARE-associated domain
MSGWLQDLLAALASHPVLQGLVAALATFILEDPTTVGSGLLVAASKMTFVTALVGVSVGIAVGDVGLYGAGRLLGPRLAGRGPLTPERMRRASRWFERNLVSAVLLSRFVPGMRLPTYVGAGMAGASLWRFAALAAGASLVWTFLLLSATVRLGGAILPLLGRYRWPVAAAAVVALAVVQLMASRRSAMPVTEETAPVVSAFEFWPPWLFYLPVAGWCLWLAVRYRGLMLPTAANPSIYSGGFIGESKSEILGLVGDDARRWIAPWITVEAPTAGADLGPAVVAATAAMDRAGLGFPVVAKPDIGQRGAGVRPVQDEAELSDYLATFPAGGRLLLQALVGEAGPPRRPEDHPSGLGDAREAGVLWWRRPGDGRGTVFSITLKIFPEIIGDGHRTVRELIEADPRASRIAPLYLERHRERLEQVLAEGERLRLAFAGNHCQGTIFRDGTPLLTPELAARVDSIAESIPEFWFGRFDIRFDDLGEFLQGEDLAIVEINGASAEATHIWDASVRLGDAYRTLFTQFRTLYEIGAANRRRGHRPLGVIRFLRDALAYRRLAGGYPQTR